MPSPARYTTVAIWLHWIIAALMIYMLFWGEDLIRVAKDATDSTGPALHITLGVTILVLSVLRLAWRVLNPPPPLPVASKAWEKTLSAATHGLFYVLMIGLPLTGWLALTHYAASRPAVAGAKAFGAFMLPQAPDTGLPFSSLHALGGKLGIALVALHVLAALKHQFYDRDGLLSRLRPM